MSELEPILGLDLGTSTCLACVIRDGEPVFIRPDLYYDRRRDQQPAHASEVMPSAFCARDGQPVVGHRALHELSSPRYANQVVQAVKRLMPKDGECEFRLGGRTYSPSEITSEYVKVLIGAAAVQLERPITDFKRAVVTVPAGFPPRAQAATLRACVLAGLREDEVLLVDEPVAAAYSLRLHEEPDRKVVLVADLGGGTFDVALWEVGKGIGPFGFAEIGRDGDNRLGGIDWDREIAHWALRGARPKLSDDLFARLSDGVRNFGSQEVESVERISGLSNLFQASEQAKYPLSQQLKRYKIADPSRPLDPGRLSPLHVSFRPTEELGDIRSADMPCEAFFRSTERLLRQCVLVCQRLFHDVRRLRNLSDYGWGDLDCIYLAGGGSRLPTVARWFADSSKKVPILDDNPQLAVAKGAAMLGEVWRHEPRLELVIAKDRYMRAIGLLVKPKDRGQPRKFYPIIPRNKGLPFIMTKSLPVFGDPQRRQLLIEFAEEDFHHDGPAHQKLAELRLKDLPPPSQPGPESAQITIECKENQAPTFHVEFRGLCESVDLNDLFKQQNDLFGPHKDVPDPQSVSV
jgi:molecular chaperone DnaK (HSP70)